MGQLSIGAHTPDFLQNTPQSLLFGTLPAVGAMGEVAVAQAVLHPGESVPLPTYRDGQAADESEIFWTALLWTATWSNEICGPPYRYTNQDHVDISFAGRVFSSGLAIIGANLYCYEPGLMGVRTEDVQVMVTVVAVRSSPPVPTTKSTWGKVKSTAR